MKYCLKQPAIDAFQWSGNEGQVFPGWLKSAIDSGDVTVSFGGSFGFELVIASKDGLNIVAPGGWVIRNDKGDIHQCGTVLFNMLFRNQVAVPESSETCVHPCRGYWRLRSGDIQFIVGRSPGENYDPRWVGYYNNVFQTWYDNGGFIAKYGTSRYDLVEFIGEELHRA